ncbi:hypothetical protein [Oxynema aestuarii]|uniref:Uncharacterized protein n=1 Tax=Oxynema aestuarii AP17 TaxID=2064643 RepID=A0A6H1TTV6_9CYAN|nr:hypothetical protein [Oxynema aestuarii]QIZ70048.1 hypothetical protein HCG48_05255 [Oxynema aestuarii AP17]RMH74692.1 MAG: hypothetical protein D6680_13950 [Cyanobacteria bacterium J007]
MASNGSQSNQTLDRRPWRANDNIRHSICLSGRQNQQNPLGYNAPKGDNACDILNKMKLRKES